MIHFAKPANNSSSQAICEDEEIPSVSLPLDWDIFIIILYSNSAQFLCFHSLPYFGKKEKEKAGKNYDNLFLENIIMIYCLVCRSSGNISGIF